MCVPAACVWCFTQKKVGVLGKSLVNRDQYFPSMYALLGVTDYLLPGKSTI